MAIYINKRYLDYIQTYDLISLVNNNHVDNNLKEILLYVYVSFFVNNLPKNHYFLYQFLYY